MIMISKCIITRKRYSIMFNLILIVLLSACASVSVRKYEAAKAAFDSQNYDVALDNVTESLVSDIKNKESIILFPSVCEKTYEYHVANAQQYENAKNWDDAAKEYDRLTSINQDVDKVVELVKAEYYGENKNEIKDSTDKIIAIKKLDVDKRKANTYGKAADLHYKEGARLAKENKYREAADEFTKTLSYMDNYKDAAVLKEKFITMANENDAKICYDKGITFVKTKDYRNASEQFNAANTYIQHYKDSEQLSIKYKNMADEQDAKVHYEKGLELIKNQNYSKAYEELVAANNYIDGYKDSTALIKQCKDNMPPSDEVISAAVGRCLQSDIPISWVGNLMGGRNANLNSVEVVKVGIYNQQRQYWPMKIHCSGTCSLKDPFNQGKIVKFDKVGEFILVKDDYGEWQAQLAGDGMFQ